MPVSTDVKIPISGVNGLEAELESKASLPISISDVTNLQTELDSKAETDTDLTLTNQAYSGNLAGATNQKEANDLIDALVIGGGGGTVQNANLSIQAADEGTPAGNARGANAVDLQTSRSGASQVASGNNSFLSGKLSTASGEDSFSHGNFNLSSGSTSKTLGRNCKATSSNTTAIGQDCEATFQGAMAIMYRTYANILGQFAYGYNSINFKKRHPSVCTLQSTTTFATADQIMYIAFTNRITISTNTKYSVVITVGANDTTNNANSSTYRVIGDLLNNAGTVTWAQEASPITVSQGAGCGTVTVSADNTNKALQVAVTPNSANTIVWQAKVELVEVQE